LYLKFNNIRDLSDARYAAAAMAEWIGFGIGHEDSLNAAKIQEIIGWCAGPKIILEIAENTDATVLSSYLDVLPVDGLELLSADLIRLENVLSLSNLQIIIYGDPGVVSGDEIITHSSKSHSNANHIQQVLRETTDPGILRSANPWAISVDCFSVQDPALKNYDTWNDFFEALESA
jgi:hypothetical protein